MEERPFHPLDYVSVLRRRKWWFVAPLVLSIVVGTALAMLLPRQYTSEAEIGIAEFGAPDTGEPAEEQPPHIVES